jgi:endonuclease G, mitochondrial
MRTHKTSMNRYLVNEEIHQLIDAILSGGLSTPEARDELLTCINPGYVATLPMYSNFLDQIRSDLVQMNSVPYLLGYEVPLKIWLENGVQRLRRSFRPEQKLFEQILEKIAAKSQDVIAAAKGITLAPSGSDDQMERIIHQDDLLPWGWLQAGLAVGTSVARLIVPRYENGQLRYNPGSTTAIRYLGTGWLIGHQYLITNHHVINARSENEANASRADLNKQVQDMEVQFDYDSEGMAGASCTVESLAAWVPCNATPILDFAILKLTKPSQRKPLILAPKAVQEASKGILPVNIVQHPGGSPKMLGARNNLVSSLGDYDLSYYTDTMRGSSGSPVCNDLWQVVALHRAWEFVHNNLTFQGKKTAWRNVGVRIDRIIEYLQRNCADLWTEIGVELT